jgi:hypothetical protein
MNTSEELIRIWGIQKLRNYGYDIVEDAKIKLTEIEPSRYGFCETCGPDPYYMIIEDDTGHRVQEYGTLGEMLKEILELNNVEFEFGG